MTLSRVWLAVALLLPALLALLVPLPTVDLAYQVRTGELILASHSIPVVDTYTFTVAGQPWTDQQWLAQILLALGFRAGGWEALAVIRALLVAGTTGLLVVVGALCGASVRTSSLLALVAFLVAAPALALRPQLLAIVVFAALLALAAARERHPRAFLAAPLLVVLWVNLHGSFVLAPLLLAHVLLDDLGRGRDVRRSAVVLALGLMATLVNPFSAGVWAYAVGIGANQIITDRVSEWQRTSPFTVTGALFYASVIGAGLLAWRGRARLAWPNAIWLFGMAFLGAWAVRGVAWWPAGALPVIALALAPSQQTAVPETIGSTVGPDDRRRPSPRPARYLNGAVIGALGLAIIAALPWWRPADLLAGRVGLLGYAPSGLAARLGEHVRRDTKVFVPQIWGSWFEWAVPDARYFVDARFELYPQDVWADLDRVEAGGAAADEALDRRGIEVLVLPVSWPAPSGAWATLYADSDGSILARVPPSAAGTFDSGMQEAALRRGPAPRGGGRFDR